MSSGYAYVGGNPLSYTDPYGLMSTLALKRSGMLDALGGGPEDLVGDLVAIGDFSGTLIVAAYESAHIQQSSGLLPGYWPADIGASEWGRRQGVGAREGKGFYPDSADTFTKAHTGPKERPCRNASIAALSTNGISLNWSGGGEGEAEAAVASEVNATLSMVTEGTAAGPISGRISVGGTQVEYRAFPPPNGTVGVCTIFPVL